MIPPADGAVDVRNGPKRQKCRVANSSHWSERSEKVGSGTRRTKVLRDVTGKPGDYEVPGEYLDDETFAAMLAEAQKYIGYPYVWGGSSPATSFDCSGYVSWVINHSGWNVGRLGAQGLYNICTPTSSPKPGDLVFFKGTYDTPGVSHCGIYVGDGKMLHCGDPIGYANLNTSYWQSHFYAYGRLP